MKRFWEVPHTVHDIAELRVGIPAGDEVVPRSTMLSCHLPAMDGDDETGGDDRRPDEDVAEAEVSFDHRLGEPKLFTRIRMCCDVPLDPEEPDDEHEHVAEPDGAHHRGGPDEELETRRSILRREPGLADGVGVPPRNCEIDDEQEDNSHCVPQGGC